MNIFILDKDPGLAAVAHCDKHLIKMLLETAQLLSTAHRLIEGDQRSESLGLYKAAYPSHPCAVWVRTERGAYEWTLTLFKALCAEYTHRYGKVHKTSALLPGLSVVPFFPRLAPAFRLERAPQAMPDCYKHPGDPVAAYREYYDKEKRRFAKWTKRIPPDWWPKELDKCSSTT